jgi:hypothetical protein
MLLDWIEERNVWPAGRIDENRRVLAEVRGQFADNFWREGQLIANNPERRNLAELPRFRHGVCEAGGPFGWTQRNEHGRYVSPEALAEAPPLPEAEREVLKLRSVSLTPLYFESPMLGEEELAGAVQAVAEDYLDTGRLPSRPDSDRAVGYDYGLTLYAFAELGLPAGERLYKQTLSVLDETGAWAEYYENHRPQGSRCRPWESAINLEGLLRWAQTQP